MWHDLYHGIRLDGISCDSQTKTATLNLFVESAGYGAISVTLAEAVDENIEEFLSIMQDLTSIPLHDYRNTWTFLPQEVQDLKSFTNRSIILQ